MSDLCRALRCLLFATLLTSCLGVYARDILIVPIGFSGPLTGMSEVYGRSLVNAVRLAIDQANQRNLVIDNKKAVFTLLAQDDKHDAHLAVLVANYLIQAGAVGVIGNTNTTNSMITGKTYDAAHLAHISPATTGRGFTQQGYGSAFRVVGHDDAGVSYLSRYLLDDLGVKRISVIDNMTPFGTGVANAFASAVTAAGGEIISRSTVNGRTSDFNAVIEDVRNKKPELIFFGGNAEQAAVLARNMKRLNLNIRVASALAGAAGPIFLEVAAGGADNTIAIEAGLPPEKMPEWKRFENAYRARYDNVINPFTVFAYDATNVLIEAIRQANSIDRQKVVDSLHAIKYRGVTGMISFDASGDLNNPGFTVYQVRKQKWQAVKVFNAR